MFRQRPSVTGSNDSLGFYPLHGITRLEVGIKMLAHQAVNFGSLKAAVHRGRLCKFLSHHGVLAGRTENSTGLQYRTTFRATSSTLGLQHPPGFRIKRGRSSLTVGQVNLSREHITRGLITLIMSH